MNRIGFITFTGREVHRFLSLYNQTLVPGLLTTVLYIVVFGNALGSRIGEIKDVAYMHYIIPGLAMMNVITNAGSNSSSSLFQAKMLKFIDDILITPLSGMEVATGYILGGMLRGVINGILVIFVGMALTGMQVAHPLEALVFLIVVGWTFGAIGLLIGIYAKSFDNIQMLMNFFITPLVFLGGVFYSIDMLPPFWRQVSLFNPLYYMINGLRHALLDIADTPAASSLLISVIMAGLATLLGATLFTRGYRIKE